MKKILIIDDDETFIKTSTDFLRSEGYEVFNAVDGLEGLEVTKSNSPDLILLDVMMPNGGGMDFLKVLHKENDEDLKKIPVLIVSNLSSMNRVNEALRYGAQGYILKSDESLKTIIKSIESIIGR